MIKQAIIERHMAKNLSDLWSMAGAEMRSTNQQPSRNGMLPTTIDLEVDPYPVKPSDETPVLANTFATAL